MSSASMLIVHIQYQLSPSHIIAFSLVKCDTKASALVNPYKSFILTPKPRKSLYIDVEVPCLHLPWNKLVKFVYV